MNAAEDSLPMHPDNANMFALSGCIGSESSAAFINGVILLKQSYFVLGKICCMNCLHELILKVYFKDFKYFCSSSEINN